MLFIINELLEEYLYLEKLYLKLGYIQKQCNIIFKNDLSWDLYFLELGLKNFSELGIMSTLNSQYELTWYRPSFSKA